MPIHQLLVLLTIVFVAGRLGAEIARRLHQPEVAGELIAGILVGPAVLGWVPAQNETLEALAELGVIFLLFSVGLDTEVSELRRVGQTAISVAVIGAAIPFALGFGLMLLLGSAVVQAIFIGAAMVATSVGVTAAVLTAKGKLATREAQTILGAAVVDDILTLLLLGIVTALVQNTVSISSVAVLGVSALGFVVVIGTYGKRFISRLLPDLSRLRINEPELAVTIAIALGLAASSAALGLAPIIGAFLAGIILGERRAELELEQRMLPLTSFFVPFFFVHVGTQVETTVLTTPRVLMLMAAVTFLAIIGKFAGGALASYRMGPRSAAIIGVGMVPRGEVGIIVASLAREVGAVGDDLYGVVVAMSLLTSILAPPVLSRLFDISPTNHSTQ